MKFLSERYDLCRMPMVGASAGAIAATLGACGVDPATAVEHAHRLSFTIGIWDAPAWAFTGRWGTFIEQWLRDLLPPNAADICRGRVTILVTTLPDGRQVGRAKRSKATGSIPLLLLLPLAV
jgi:predicted acylesterase/phospholipase RssA